MKKTKKILSIALVSTLAIGLTTNAFAGGDKAKGKKVFANNCATCHGATGKGDGVAAAALNPKPNNFSKGKFKYGSTDADLAKTIKNGKGPMPPWGSILSAKDIDDVVAHIRSLKK